LKIRNICFGHVPIAVRQGRQRFDAASAGEEQFGRFTARQNKMYWLYVNSGKLILAAMYLRRVRVVGRSFAAAPTNISKSVTPPAHAAKYFDVGLQRPYRGQAFRKRRRTALQIYSEKESILPALSV
jgi:hypothetical protein